MNDRQRQCAVCLHDPCYCGKAYEDADLSEAQLSELRGRLESMATRRLAARMTTAAIEVERKRQQEHAPSKELATRARVVLGGHDVELSHDLITDLAQYVADAAQRAGV